MLTATKQELEQAFANCVKQRGRDIAIDILQTMARTQDLDEVAENRRFLTVAALKRRPPAQQGSAASRTRSATERASSVHDALARIGVDAFARRKAAD